MYSGSKSPSTTAVRVGLDAGAGVLCYAVLVDDPFQRGAVAEAVVEDLWGMPSSVSESLARRLVLS